MFVSWIYSGTSVLAALCFASMAIAQPPDCVPPSGRQLIIYRAGSLTRAFQPLVQAFTCQTGIQVKDVAMGSVDAGRQITAGGQACDLYAPPDYLDIDLLMKPAGYSDFDIVFAKGRMVMAYSESAVTAKKLPRIVEPNSPPFHPPDSIPKAAAKWYEILLAPGVTSGGGQAFLDPGAYRAHMIFQLAEAYYKVPLLYNNLLGRQIIAGAGAWLGKTFDFQFTYEHNARATAASNPDYRYVDLPDEINLSDPQKNEWYRQHALVVLPGLGTPRSARTVPIPGARLAWGIALMTNAPNRENAVKFLQLLLSPTGTAMLNENGPEPISPAQASPADWSKLPPELRALVKALPK